MDFAAVFFKRDHNAVLELILDYLETDEQSALNFVTTCKDMVRSCKRYNALRVKVRNYINFLSVEKHANFIGKKKLSSVAKHMANGHNLLKIYLREGLGAKRAMKDAIIWRELEVVKHLKEVEGLEVTMDHLDIAGRNVDREKFRYLYKFVDIDLDKCVDEALEEDNVGLAKLFVEVAKADETVWYESYTPLEYFTFMDASYMNYDAPRKIVQHFKERNCDFNEVDPDNGNTPLIAFCCNTEAISEPEALGFFRELSSAGADVTAVDDIGRTAFEALLTQTAIPKNYTQTMIKVTNELMRCGLDLTWTMIFRWFSNKEFADPVHLIDYFVKIAMRNKLDYTHVDPAARKPVLVHLFETPDIEVATGLQFTNSLIDAGADTTVGDYMGRMASYMARSNECWRSMENMFLSDKISKKIMAQHGEKHGYPWVMDWVYKRNAAETPYQWPRILGILIGTRAENKESLISDAVKKVSEKEPEKGGLMDTLRWAFMCDEMMVVLFDGEKMATENLPKSFWFVLQFDRELFENWDYSATYSVRRVDVKNADLKWQLFEVVKKE